MEYVALLRGINVGGKNKIDMNMLKQTFENAGMEDVVTYINSGNIIFSAGEGKSSELSRILEGAILQDFDLQIKVLLRNMEEFEKVMNVLPDTWKNDKEIKSDVVFLWEDIDDESLMERLKIRPEIDTVKYVPGVLLWSVERKNSGKSGLSKVVGTELYKQMTIRNVNTVRKIYDLMKK